MWRLLFKDLIVIPVCTVAVLTAFVHAYCRAPREGITTAESFMLTDWLLVTSAGLLVLMLLLTSVITRQPTPGHGRTRTCADGPATSPRRRRRKHPPRPRLARPKARRSGKPRIGVD